MKNSALYIHIPFCDHKCIYCDFYSIITSDNIKPFFNSLKKEINYYSLRYKEHHYFTSVFFGGGTPSLMCPADILDIISYLREKFYISEDAEITLETNPGTVTDEKLREFLRAGINRISIGIQSFDEGDLKFLTRIHNKNTAVKTVYSAAAAGFNNISIDLIFNLPGQTKIKWLENLSQAVELPLVHISAYSLILERGTILNKMVLEGIVKMQDDNHDADLYETTIEYLSSNGFRQYEVSNFAKADYECIHNLAYWRYRDYLGMGPSAHSYIDGKRWWNFSSLKRYIAEVDRNSHAEASSEFPSSAQKLEEYTMLALRSTGIDKEDLSEKFGNAWYESNSRFLDILSSENFISIDQHSIKLTPKGYALCDEIIARLK